MYAIVEDGGKQYRVEKGDRVHIEKRAMQKGALTIEFDKVLMLGNGASSKIGAPTVAGAKVVGRIEADVKGPKLEIVKFRRRKGYKLHKGHRQKHLRVLIEDIQG